MDDNDVFGCYTGLCKTENKMANAHYQGIDTTSDDRNITRIRFGAGNRANKAKDAAIANAYGNRFHIPLDFELLESHMPFFQSALGDRMEYELTLNDYVRVVRATGDDASKYTIEGIALEFEMMTNRKLAENIRNQYAGKMTILYDRNLRHHRIVANKSDLCET